MRLQKPDCQKHMPLHSTLEEGDRKPANNSTEILLGREGHQKVTRDFEELLGGFLLVHFSFCAETCSSPRKAETGWPCVGGSTAYYRKTFLLPFILNVVWPVCCLAYLVCGPKQILPCKFGPQSTPPPCLTFSHAWAGLRCVLPLPTAAARHGFCHPRTRARPSVIPLLWCARGRLWTPLLLASRA